MKRRRFLKDAALAGAGLLCAPVWKQVTAQQIPDAVPQHSTDVPSLDDLAGDWISGKMFEQTPAISNFHGGLQAGRNILSVNSFVNFPLAQGGEFAKLSLDGMPIAAQDFRWYAYQMLRRAATPNLEIVTTARMPFEASGILFRVDVTNRTQQAHSAKLAVVLRPAVREYSETWHWGPPRPEARELQEFANSVVQSDGKVLLTQDTHSKSAVAAAFVQQPDELSEQTQEATWDLSLSPGESRHIEFVMAAGTNSRQVITQASEWKTNFDRIYDQAKARWEQRFLDAFKPDNGHFSGNLPTLLTPDEKLRRLYYMSVLSLLELERTNLHPDFPRVFITAGPRWAPTLTYFWDTSIYPTVFSLLDPVAVKQMLTLFLRTDIHSCYAIDIPSQKGVGPWYSANDYMIFQLATTYMNVTRDWEFLQENIGGKTVIDRLEESALYWRNLTKGTSLLANYGSPDNLLETVPTYEQRVPSFNAANVWMMRTAAKLRRRSGEAGKAANLEQQANALAKQVLDLYVDGKGYWACLLDNGQRIEVRHCIDFFFAITCMQEDLGPRRIREMIAFVERELWTDDWLRALSLSDGAAAQSLRADHGCTGAFDAWPAYTAEAMFRVNEKQQALTRLRNLTQVTREGPFGQAHFVAQDGHPSRKAVSMDYFEDSSAAFAEIIIRTLFAFAPSFDEHWTWSSPRCPGLEGKLLQVRYKGESLERSPSR